MAKSSKNKDLDLTRLVMGWLAAMPHKPHVAKKQMIKFTTWNLLQLSVEPRDQA
jgi:hypothetical protein